VFGAGGLGHVAGGLRRPLASPARTSLAWPHQPRLPPPASLAPIGLACPHGEEEGSALVLGIGLRLWQSALGFPSLSFIYKSIVFPSLWIDRQFIIFSSSPSSSRVNTLGGHDRSRLEEYLEVVDLEAVDRKGGVTAAETLFIG